MRSEPEISESSLPLLSCILHSNLRRGGTDDDLTKHFTDRIRLPLAKRYLSGNASALEIGLRQALGAEDIPLGCRESIHLNDRGQR